DIWYSCNNVPLRWHYPVGLLHDLQVHHASSSAAEEASDGQLWRITVHTQSYPKGSLKMAIPSLNSMQDMYMSMIKESSFLRYGTAKKVMHLPKHEQTALWESLVD
ncbi:autophagy-related protein 5, partial [Syncephalis pseudoplumigaleata]